MHNADHEPDGVSLVTDVLLPIGAIDTPGHRGPRGVGPATGCGTDAPDVHPNGHLVPQRAPRTDHGHFSAGPATGTGSVPIPTHDNVLITSTTRGTAALPTIRSTGRHDDHVRSPDRGTDLRRDDHGPAGPARRDLTTGAGSTAAAARRRLHRHDGVPTGTAAPVIVFSVLRGGNRPGGPGTTGRGDLGGRIDGAGAEQSDRGGRGQRPPNVVAGRGTRARATSAIPAVGGRPVTRRAIADGRPSMSPPGCHPVTLVRAGARPRTGPTVVKGEHRTVIDEGRTRIPPHRPRVRIRPHR